jgi:hypothetical protein
MEAFHEMPDYKVYIPEAKASVMYRFKEQFGRESSGMILSFMETSLSADPEPKKTKADTPDPGLIYDTFFGDIQNERQFLSLFGDRQSAETAIQNRSADLFSKHPDIYTDVIAQFKKNHPNFANIKGV